MNFQNMMRNMNYIVWLEHMCNLSQEIEDKAVARIVLNMHKIGYTSNQIADAVGISLAAVATIINEQKKAVKA